MRFRRLGWALISAGLHAWMLLGPRVATTRDVNPGTQPPTTWLESAPAPAKAPPPEPPQHFPPPIAEPHPAPARRAKTRAVTTPETTQPLREDGDGVPLPTIGEAVAASEDGQPDDMGDGAGVAAPSGVAVEAVNQRRGAPAQLSVWLNSEELERFTLLRPALTALMAIPGYRDVFRGSSIRPFTDLRRLRVFLAGTRPEKLTVAGVHARGEDALLDAAKRVAAMRSLELSFRGGGDLRATAWIDNSGIDRGLAVHEADFLIGARTRMPALLGTADPGARVGELSKLRRGVIMAAFLEDVRSYIPALADCGLEALHTSVAAHGGEIRMSFVAHYESSVAAMRAPICLDELQGPVATRAPRLVSWLKSASGAAGSYSTQLRTPVTRDDVEHLLDEISAALRRTLRT